MTALWTMQRNGESNPPFCQCGHPENAHRLIEYRRYVWCDDCYYGSFPNPEHPFEASHITPLPSASVAAENFTEQAETDASLTAAMAVSDDT